jgi:hypothetical protein
MRGIYMPNLVQVLSALVKEQKRLQGKLHSVDAAITALRGMNGAGRASSSISQPRRRLSVAARRRIAAAQRARWAKFRAQKKAA